MPSCALVEKLLETIILQIVASKDIALIKAIESINNRNCDHL